MSRVLVHTLGAVVLAVGVSACATSSSGPHEVIQAKRIELVDDQGQVTAVLEGSSVILIDSHGITRIRLQIDDAGPELVMMDDQGRPKADLTVAMSDPSLMMGDIEGSEPQLQATVSQTGSGLWLRDVTGKTQAEISVTPHGTSLTMRESDTQAEVAFGLGGKPIDE